jgi:hypothetical protein
MDPDDRRQAFAAIECPPNRLEVEAEAPHCGDLVEPLYLLSPVPPMASTGSRGWHEQADVVVVVKCPHGDAGGVGEFTDTPFPTGAANLRA